jgi:formate hydrogenlyase transcriptional activator
MSGIKRWVFNDRRKTMNSNLATHFSTSSGPQVLKPRFSTHLPRLRRGRPNGIGPTSAAADYRIIPLTQGTLAGDNGHGDFIALLTSVLERFVNCPPQQLEPYLQSAFHQICQSLGIETAGLWRLSSSVGESFSLAQLYPVPEIQRGQRAGALSPEADGKQAKENQQSSLLRAGSESKDCLPWLTARLQRGESIVSFRLADLPIDAARDRETLTRLGARSGTVLPILERGKIVGALSFTRNREEAFWPEALVERLEFVTQVLGTAVARRVWEDELNAALRERGDLKTALNEHAIVAATDCQGKLTYVNDKFCAISKCAREELLGQNYPPQHCDSHESFLEVWSTVRCGRVWHGQIKNRAKDGSIYWVAATLVPFLDLLGKPSQCVAIHADITEQKLAEEALTNSYAEIKQLRERLEAESAFLTAEIKVSQAHAQIIGHSQAIKRVLHQVEQAAPADCAVLVSGETGTGKELIAQEIHRLSRRKDHHMVLVNCAALPSALVESELFGRERGAYTGALSSQVGRFEVADGSTIFLDELGELSLEVQAKLLRVLQQGEFQRLGSPKTHKVDVRVIAATNRDLAEEVRKGLFRDDLYYRLKVFPIEIPPLRERREDIPLLAFACMEEFSTRMGKKLTKVPRKAIEALEAHPWPGNIRELRNVIEHSVIVSSGDTLKLTALGDMPLREAEPVTLAEAEREHIIKALESTGWRIKGAHGAARRLALQPSTLYSRMQKLGIPNRRQKDEMTTQG